MSLQSISTLRELFPIKLVGGFIAVDNHVGCMGCPWCLCRRQTLWRTAFQSGLRLSGPFTHPEEAAALLQGMLPANRAKIPIRFGHNGDAGLQWSFGAGLYHLLPTDQPFVFMTRLPLSHEHKRLFQGQPNLLAKVSITPQYPWTHFRDAMDPQLVLASLQGIPTENLFVLVGPVVNDSLDEARNLLLQLPPGTWAEIKPLTRSGIPGMEAIPVPTESDLDPLRQEARARGVNITDFFGCRLRIRLGRGFYKTDDRPEYRDHGVCRDCAQIKHCWGFQDDEVRESIRREAAWIGLTLESFTPLGPRSTWFQCREPAGRGDETYLSELSNHNVKLSSVPTGSQGGSFFLEEETVLERWQRVGMYPSSIMQSLAQSLAHRLKA